jgi:hypothetical protein
MVCWGGRRRMASRARAQNRHRPAGRSTRTHAARSIGLVVEGQTEGTAFRQLPTLLPSCPVLDRPAVVKGIGSDATPGQVAKRVAREVAFLQPDNRKVIVCIDLESRPLAAADFANQVAAALAEALPEVGGRPGYPVNVIVADRAFEAWLLADIACLAKNGTRPPKKCYESHMRPMVGGRRCGYHYGDDLLRTFLGRYDKTRDGPRLFAKLNFAHARIPCDGGGRGSRSLAAFLEALGT